MHLWSPSADNTSDKAWKDMLDTVMRCTELAEKHGIYDEDDMIRARKHWLDALKKAEIG